MFLFSNFMTYLSNSSRKRTETQPASVYTQSYRRTQNVDVLWK